MPETAAGGSAVEPVKDLRISVDTQVPADWDELVGSDPLAGFFHTSFWTGTTAAQLPAAEPLWLTAHRGDRLVGGLAALRRPGQRGLLGSVGRIDHLESHLDGTGGGPLIAAALSEAEGLDVSRLLVGRLLAQRSGPLESISLVLGPGAEERYGPQLHRKSGWIRESSPTSVISLDGGLEVVEMQRLSNNKRNERNRGLKRGAQFRVTTEPTELADYYPLYESACAHWGQTPMPLVFLQSLLADPSGRVFFSLISLEGKIIGGHLCFHHGDRVTAWTGVTDPAYARTHFPSTLVFWCNVVEACRRGARWLDVGGSGGIGSLSSFKKHFGAEEQMRGLYLNETPLLQAGRRIRDHLTSLRGALSGKGLRRWHDQSGNAPGGGGSRP